MKLDTRGWLIVVFAMAGLAAAIGCSSPSIMSSKGGGGGGGARASGGAGGGTLRPDFVLPPATDGGPDASPVMGPREGEESCAQRVETAKLSPVDLLFLLDASGSMAFKAGPRNRWEMARDALVAFLKDTRSSGLGVGLQFFPLHTETCQDHGDCFLPQPGGCVIFSACLAPGAPLASGASCGVPGDAPCPAGSTCTPLGRCSASGGDCIGMGQPCPSGLPNDVCGPRPRQCRLGPSARGSCDVPDYQKLPVPITDLPGATARLVGAVDARMAVGGTPLGPALKGAFAHLAARPATGRPTALVIVSDGLPEGCVSTNLPGILADVQAARMRTPSISTYVVGVFAATDPMEPRDTMRQIAVAGGTQTYFEVTANDQLTEKFLAALNQIRGAALSCDLVIPPPSSGQIDFGKVNVHVDGTAGPVDLVYVERRDRCDATKNGWYYDVDPAMTNPTRVQLCPGVCERLKADPKASIQLRFGCKSRIIE